jgi:AcrR family transcriptional regulator
MIRSRKRAQRPLSEQARRKTRKSEATRKRILDAAIRCFVEIGYRNTTPGEIAARARVTRGALQYYFPTGDDVLRGAVTHLHRTSISAYVDAVRIPPPGVDEVDYMVDVMWDFFRQPEYIAWLELVSVSRTDPKLRSILEPATFSYEQTRRLMGRDLFAHYRIPGVELDAARDYIRVFLEGLATTLMGYDSEARHTKLLDMLKRHAHMMLVSPTPATRRPAVETRRGGPKAARKRTPRPVSAKKQIRAPDL